MVQHTTSHIPGLSQSVSDRRTHRDRGRVAHHRAWATRGTGQAAVRARHHDALMQFDRVPRFERVLRTAAEMDRVRWRERWRTPPYDRPVRRQVPYEDDVVTHVEPYVIATDHLGGVTAEVAPDHHAVGVVR